MYKIAAATYESKKFFLIKGLISLFKREDKMLLEEANICQVWICQALPHHLSSDQQPQIVLQSHDLSAL